NAGHRQRQDQARRRPARPGRPTAQSTERPRSLLRQARSHPIILALPQWECQTAGIVRHYMILYRLRCSKGHEFESWFKDSKTYERQEKKSLIGCAVCGDSKVARALMAPRLGTKGNKKTAVVANEVVA